MAGIMRARTPGLMMRADDTDTHSRSPVVGRPRCVPPRPGRHTCKLMTAQPTTPQQALSCHCCAVKPVAVLSSLNMKLTAQHSVIQRRTITPEEPDHTDQHDTADDHHRAAERQPKRLAETQGSWSPPRPRRMGEGALGASPRSTAGETPRRCEPAYADFDPYLRSYPHEEHQFTAEAADWSGH